jgi:hypothetical protein
MMLETDAPTAAVRDQWLRYASGKAWTNAARWVYVPDISCLTVSTAVNVANKPIRSSGGIVVSAIQRFDSRPRDKGDKHKKCSDKVSREPVGQHF